MYVCNAENLMPSKMVLVKTYPGFEGCDGYIKLSTQYGEDSEFMFEAIRELENMSLFYVTSEGSEIPEKFKSKFSFLRYDFAICEEDGTAYSSICQEVFSRHIPELTAYERKLNDKGLFPTEELAQEYAETHHDMDLRGKDVELEDCMRVHKVWKFVK